MEPEPWEALDVDDSELSSLLRPCTHKPQNSPSPPSPETFSLLAQPLSPTPNPPPNPTLIPGPAGAVQAAMLRKRHNKTDPLCVGDEPIPTQEYIRRAVEDPCADDDDDFSRDPWLFALDFIHRQGLADDGGTIGTPLSWIKTEPKMANRKVAQVVAIIKSCTPNGLGDLMVTLKDPTGTIDASIHHKVLVEGSFGKDISVGTVLILHKVSVFSPSQSARYLNITLSNVVKIHLSGGTGVCSVHDSHIAICHECYVTCTRNCSKDLCLCLNFQAVALVYWFQAIPKDRGPQSQRNNPASTVTPSVHVVEYSKQPALQQKVSTLSQERTEGIINSLRQTGYLRGRVHNNKVIEGDEAVVSSCGINSRTRSQDAFLEKEHSVRQETISGTKKAALLAGNNKHEETVVLEMQPSPQNLARRDSQLESSQSNHAPNMVRIANNQENVAINGDLKQRQLPISTGPLPQWTDEQLDELFAFD